jgi:hypothetical protein
MSVEFRNWDALGWLVFAGLVLGALVWWSYYRQPGHRELSPARRGVLAGLRWTLLGLILLMLLRPVLALKLDERIRRTVVLLADASKSMNIQDQRQDEADQKRAEVGMGVIDGMDQPLDAGRLADAKVISRAELMKAVLNNGKLNLIENLKQDFNLKTFQFGPAITAVEDAAWLVDYRATMNTTAIGDSVREVLERERGQPLAGIVLVTDGGNNSGSPPLEAAEEAKREGVPIFTYGVGITSPRDIIVSKVSAPEIAFEKDDVAVTVQLRGQGLKGESGRLSLKLGSDEVVSKDVTFTGADEDVVLHFTPQKKGDFEMTASVPVRDDETSKENNVAKTRVRVIDDKIKVLYIEQSPRWEFRFLQEVLLRDRRVQPSFVLVEGDPSLAQEPGTPYLAQFPAAKEALFKYDMVIIGDVDPKVFSGDQLEAIEEFVSKFGGACLFLAGKNFMPDAYRDGVVEKMLPVEMEADRVGEGDTTRPVKLELSPLGRSSAMLQLAATEIDNAELWAAFPPVYWDYQVARAKPAARVLIQDQDAEKASSFGNMPVFATQQCGVGQVLYLGTDELWRWRKNEGVNEYPVLWGQIVEGGALAHLLGNSKKTQLSVDKDEYNVGDPVTVFARLYNGSFQPISDAQAAAQYEVNTGVGPGEKEPLILRAVPDEPGMYRGDFVAAKAGRYRVESMREPGTGVEFNATEPQFELGETAMNEDLLRQMAAVSGGQFFREEDLGGLLNALNAKPETVQTARDLEVWASPFYFALMCLMAVTEWILRKRWGLK